MNQRPAGSAIKTARAGLVFLHGCVKPLAMLAGTINGKFGHFDSGSMAGRQADAWRG